MLEDDAYGDAMRPWQVVAIMSRERLDELIHQKRRHDEDCRRASRGGPPVVEGGWKAMRRLMKMNWSMVMW